MKQEIDLFIAGPNKEPSMVARTKTHELHSNYSDVLTGNWCFKSTFSLQDKEGSKPYQAPPRHIAYTPQEPFIIEHERLKSNN